MEEEQRAFTRYAARCGAERGRVPNPVNCAWLDAIVTSERNIAFCAEVGGPARSAVHEISDEVLRLVVKGVHIEPEASVLKFDSFAGPGRHIIHTGGAFDSRCGPDR